MRMGNNFGNIVNLIFALIGAIIVVGISIKVIINMNRLNNLFKRHIAQYIGNIFVIKSIDKNAN